MLAFTKVTTENHKLLTQFLKTAGDSLTSFRYFNNRDFNVLKNHRCTYLLLENNTPVCYGHLDEEAGITWLGIVTSNAFKRRGYGTKMMNKLIAESRALKIKNIHLTVDKDNVAAILLYMNFGFTQINEDENYYIFRLIVS